MYLCSSMHCTMIQSILIQLQSFKRFFILIYQIKKVKGVVEEFERGVEQARVERIEGVGVEARARKRGKGVDFGKETDQDDDSNDQGKEDSDDSNDQGKEDSDQEKHKAPARKSKVKVVVEDDDSDDPHSDPHSDLHSDPHSDPHSDLHSDQEQNKQDPEQDMQDSDPEQNKPPPPKVKRSTRSRKQVHHRKQVVDLKQPIVLIFLFNQAILSYRCSVDNNLATF